MKPVLSEVFDINNKKRSLITKRSYLLIINSTEKRKRNQLRNNKTFNIINPTNKIKKKESKIINSAIEEKNSKRSEDNIKKGNSEYHLLQKFRKAKPFFKKEKKNYINLI